MEEKKLGIIQKTVNYLKETQAEAKKVSWPTAKYVWSATVIIIVMVILIAVGIMVIDYGFGQAITMLTRAR